MRIVILRALGLGDFLAGIPAYRAVRRAFGDAHITLAAPRVLSPLAALLDGAIDEVVDTPGLVPLDARLHDADLAIDLHGCGPASHDLLLATAPRRLIAFHHPDVPASRDGAPFRADEHEVQRWCRLLAHAGIPADPDALDLPAPRERVPRRVHGATLVHPGAASAARRWPAERWAAVARAEMRIGRRVIITGSPAEATLAAAVAQRAGITGRDVYAGRTGLGQLAALVAASARVACGDTGVAHLATALRRPSVVLFGPTSPAHWGPPARRNHRVLWHGTTGDPHGTELDAGLAAIRVEQVIAALDDLPDAATVSCAQSGSTHAAEGAGPHDRGDD